VTDTAPETGTTTTGAPETGPNSPETGGAADTSEGVERVDWQAQAEKYQALMRKEEAKAKANAAAAKELDKLKRAAMTETEAAVAEAVANAQAETAAEVTARLGGRLVIAEIRGAVAGRLDAEAVDALTERLDLSTFLTADGDVDAGAVQAFAQRIAPDVHSPPTFPDLGQGARSSANGNAFQDPLLRDLKGKLGITT
jgi:hypothetical protein